MCIRDRDFAQEREWCEKSSLDWELLKEKEHKQLQDYVEALLTLYKDYPALYEYDDTSDGFEWINPVSYTHLLVAVRRP